MTRSRAFSPQALAVMQALAATPSRYRYGYDLVGELGLKSGSLYPILVRLADRGLLEAAWEQSLPGRPPRHMYRLTTAGAQWCAEHPPEASRAVRPARRPRVREA